MSVKVLYFAALRDAVDCSEETVELDGAKTLGELRARLAARGERWAPLAATRNVRMARNQHMAPGDTAVSDGDEIAFFPPVTGG
ncbi:MAG: molybdopterin converting factor subunit 1 [Azoarcus sp.]|nr:molybdopterin converting factor subunit 1 [Azoarcus sp.]